MTQYPFDYRNIVKDYVKRTFFDPYSLRDVSLSYPNFGRILFNQGWIVCLEANAKNRMGAYTGLQRTAYLIVNRKIVNSLDRAELCYSSSISFSPFPELDSNILYNYKGFDKNGIHSNTKTLFDDDGYDKDGYDKDGFDNQGYDKDGYDKDGYNYLGYDRKGYDKNRIHISE